MWHWREVIKQKLLVCSELLGVTSKRRTHCKIFRQVAAVRQLYHDISPPSSGQFMHPLHKMKLTHTHTHTDVFFFSGLFVYTNWCLFSFCFQGAERKIRDEERKLLRKKSKGTSRVRNNLVLNENEKIIRENYSSRVQFEVCNSLWIYLPFISNNCCYSYSAFFIWTYLQGKTEVSGW